MVPNIDYPISFATNVDSIWGFNVKLRNLRLIPKVYQTHKKPIIYTQYLGKPLILLVRGMCCCADGGTVSLVYANTVCTH